MNLFCYVIIIFKGVFGGYVDYVVIMKINMGKRYKDYVNCEWSEERFRGL